ncbi:hypothetical protein JRQ81_012171 [Phrynocephalus forsythii]|uniref:Uncharacterized protein n=1 Tax=Phrynocephalus forsythii TaxID=171643 RepID=A0A9Q0X5X9_9SAUR|nr:hypothetical protein JRQ81_012171 [Phrynocephalus forsythii]
MKMECQDLASALLGERSGGFQEGDVGGFLPRVPREQVKQEPGQGSLQQWEAQWQEFLKAVEAPHPQRAGSPWPEVGLQEATRLCTEAVQGPPEVEEQNPCAGRPSEKMRRRNPVSWVKNTVAWSFGGLAETSGIIRLPSSPGGVWHSEAEGDSEGLILVTVQHQEVEDGTLDQVGPQRLQRKHLGPGQERRNESMAVQVGPQEATRLCTEAVQEPPEVEQQNPACRKAKRENEEEEPGLLGGVWRCEAEGESEGLTLVTVLHQEVEDDTLDQKGPQWMKIKHLGGAVEERRNESMAVQACSTEYSNLN